MFLKRQNNFHPRSCPTNISLLSFQNSFHNCLVCVNCKFIFFLSQSSFLDTSFAVITFFQTLHIFSKGKPNLNQKFKWFCTALQITSNVTLHKRIKVAKKKKKKKKKKTPELQTPLGNIMNYIHLTALS